ncbi:hypothetical protein C486_08008 [Natrinema gari JCM 14663]|uniref:Uncharacterized protein n=1 Tax=Natrinema gari JCM 14663 TaxID=1230459 RepID=L9Z558_9EURY|nr:hypothetical protein C486_08008 [Natrinema gari JCM 14663]
MCFRERCERTDRVGTNSRVSVLQALLEVVERWFDCLGAPCGDSDQRLHRGFPGHVVGKTVPEVVDEPHQRLGETLAQSHDRERGVCTDRIVVAEMVMEGVGWRDGSSPNSARN